MWSFELIFFDWNSFKSAENPVKAGPTRIRTELVGKKPCRMSTIPINTHLCNSCPHLPPSDNRDILNDGVLDNRGRESSADLMSWESHVSFGPRRARTAMTSSRKTSVFLLAVFFIYWCNAATYWSGADFDTEKVHYWKYI